MFKPQKKHKARHCGYKNKPSKKQISSLLELYEDIAIDGVTLHHTKPDVHKSNCGLQLEFKF